MPRSGWIGGGQTHYVQLGGASTIDAAISICQAHPENGAGICTWTGPTDELVGYAVGTGAYTSSSSDPTWRTSRCTPQ